MGNMFAEVVEGLRIALKIFVILKSFNTTNSKKTYHIQRIHSFALIPGNIPIGRCWAG